MSTYRIITILFFSLFIGMPLSFYFIHTYKTKADNQLFQNIISDINQYKSQHGSYPADIKAATNRDVDRLYYYCDSGRNFFSLTYTKGIMNCNTVTYDSRTRQWETKFNY